MVADALGRDLERSYPADPEPVDHIRPVILAAYRAGPGRTGVVSAGRFRLYRRAIPLAMAATVLAGATGVVAAFSGPGDPFYSVRLAMDSIRIPFLVGETTALDRMEHRLDEARTSASDPVAVGAALKAYREELQRALSEAETPEQRAAVLSTLDAHSVVLDELSHSVTPAAGAGLQQAIDQVDAAQSDLLGQPSPPPQSPATPPAGGRPSATPDPGGPVSPSHGPPAR
jgi:hypothetical protein